MDPFKDQFIREDNEIFFAPNKVEKIKECIHDCERCRDQEYAFGYMENVAIYKRRIKTLKARLRKEDPFHYVVLPALGVTAVIGAVAAIAGGIFIAKN